MKIILEIKNITKTFGGVRALDNISLSITKETITAIIGPNGSGKTTLFNVINGFLKPDKGKITFKGKDITYLSPSKIARYGIGRTFQLIRVFPQMIVRDNLLLALENPLREGLLYGLNPFIRYDPGPLKEKAMNLLTMVDLQDMAEELPCNLSHGQRRLLEVMLAISLDPDLYLFDEPTAGVFQEIKDRIFELFRQLKGKGKTIIFIEHNMEVVKEIAEKVIVLDKGRVIAEGEPATVLEMSQVMEAYFGGEFT